MTNEERKTAIAAKKAEAKAIKDSILAQKDKLTKVRADIADLKGASVSDAVPAS